MKIEDTRILIISILIAALVLTAFVGVTTAETTDCGFPYTTPPDATGETVHLEIEPQEVVAMNPSAAQIMWDTGNKDKVIMLTEHALYLEGADEKEILHPQWGSFPTGEKERIINATPDIALAPTVNEDDIEYLRDNNTKVHKPHDVNSLDEVPDQVETIGRIIGDCEGADELIDEYYDEIEFAKSKSIPLDSPRITVVVPGFNGNHWVPPGDSVEAEIIEVLGGDYIFDDFNRWDQPSSEIVIERDPEWILFHGEDPEVLDAPGWRDTTAYEKDQIVEYDHHLVSQRGPRITQAMHQIVDAIRRPIEWRSVEISDAELEIQDFSINKEEVDVDEEFTVSLDVKNNGGKSGEFNLDLIADGSVISSKQIRLSFYESDTVELTGSIEESGSFQLQVNEHDIGLIEVTGEPEPEKTGTEPEPESQPEETEEPEGTDKVGEEPEELPGLTGVMAIAGLICALIVAGRMNNG